MFSGVTTEHPAAIQRLISVSRRGPAAAVAWAILLNRPVIPWRLNRRSWSDGADLVSDPNRVRPVESGFRAGAIEWVSVEMAVCVLGW